MAQQKKSKEFLERTFDGTRARFVAEKSLLSFQEYLDVVSANPAAQARDAATYLRDVFLHYGTETIERPYGTFTRYRLFDVPFDDGVDRLVGHEAAQEKVFGLLSGFVSEGRVSKLILLHGPNGSAKTSFISCMMRALEDYSRLPEGALYTFNWVFPPAKLEKGGIGFSSERSLEEMDSYAHLAEGEVDARIRNSLRDSPLLLLPRAARVELLTGLLGPGAPIPDSLTHGELSPKAREIYEALLRAYKGDLREVLKHVQVERFYVSRRYRQAAVTIDPQMRVDATVRQVTADRSLGALPPALHNLTLFEPHGDLVEANRGIIEYNDLLKRPIEAFKYLLSTCENGTVRLETMNLYLDAVFIGSCNAGHLDAFKDLPDFASFKGRIELVQVPYLIDHELERCIYAEQTSGPAIRKPMAPHTDEVAAMWAVLTRLGRPDAERYPSSVRKVLSALNPGQKAELYAKGRLPAGLTRDAENTLRGLIPELYEERRASDRYEGRYGASPRELKAALLNAARRPGFICLSPIPLFEELRTLCEQASIYEFLRLKPDGDYYKPAAFIELMEAWYLDVVEEELHQAMGLVDKTATSDLLSRYIDHVTHFVRREKRLNPMTGRYEDADEKLMTDVEGRLGLGEKSLTEFREGIMHRIAAWRMDNPEGALVYDVIFAEYVSKLNDAFYEEKRKVADRVKHDLLTFLVDGGRGLDDDATSRAESTLEALERDFGYCRDCAVEVVGYVLKQEHKDAKE